MIVDNEIGVPLLTGCVLSKQGLEHRTKVPISVEAEHLSPIAVILCMTRARNNLKIADNPLAVPFLHIGGHVSTHQYAVFTCSQKITDYRHPEQLMCTNKKEYQQNNSVRTFSWRSLFMGVWSCHAQ